MSCAVLPATNAELVQMFARPAHDYLDDIVQLCERQILGNEDASPNRRAQATQSNSKLKDGGRRPRIGSHARIVSALLASRRWSGRSPPLWRGLRLSGRTCINIQCNGGRTSGLNQTVATAYCAAQRRLVLFTIPRSAHTGFRERHSGLDCPCVIPRFRSLPDRLDQPSCSRRSSANLSRRVYWQIQFATIQHPARSRSRQRPAAALQKVRSRWSQHRWTSRPWRARMRSVNARCAR